MSMRPQWKDPVKFNKAVNEYFAECAKEGPDVFPDYAGMLIYLQIDKEYAANMQSDKWPEYEEFRRIFNTAALKRESWIARRVAVDNKAASGGFNLLKQEENGGYTAGSTKQQEKTIPVKIEGIKGGWDAFK